MECVAIIERNGKIYKAFKTQEELEAWENSVAAPMPKNPAPYNRRAYFAGWFKSAGKKNSVVGVFKK